MGQKKVSHKTYQNLLSGISGILQEARRASARSVNAILTATYWEIGRRIVKFEQKGNFTAAYGEEIVESLAVDLTKRFGRGFSRRNLFQIRMFYVSYAKKFQTLSGISRKQKVQALSAQLPEFSIKNIRKVFPLSWPQYVRLLSVKDDKARNFYETAAVRGGWSVRQLDRQINSQFYERLLLSRNKAVMLKKGKAPRPEDILTPEEEIKDPMWPGRSVSV